MLRTILTVFGVAELLRPEVLIRAAERLALENPEECELRPWTVPVARVEGVAFLLLVRRRKGSYSTFKKFLGVVGLLSVLYPREYLGYATKLAYTDAANCQWRPWVYHATRLAGLFYVIVAVKELAKPSRAEIEEDSQPN
ncbi:MULTISPECIES: hypothetical protein [Haloferax]|uniref:Uncharacterized protein n=2 Tax=Haloferax TaxID=2251 RepID=A0A6G1Z2J0_9EURY|nr:MULTISPECIES: hypothetical protein [Haloferax]KAB1187853.1 hypothetical protein Hfx1149_07325 [Haloferax sp. CBA1149]MRW80514.1 hypothetical protein [Haloferax marinisediminis]